MFYCKQQLALSVSLFLFSLLYTFSSKAEGTTLIPDGFALIGLSTFSTEKSLTFDRENAYRKLENYENVSITNIENVQKFNNNVIPQNTILDSISQLQPETNIQINLSSPLKYQKNENPMGYTQTNKSNISRQRTISHRQSAFEKHKMNHHSYGRYNHKNHKNDFSKKKFSKKRNYRNRQIFSDYNQQSPYLEDQLNYYKESDGVDNLFHFTPTKAKNHRYYHHHHHHYHSNRHRKTNEYNHKSKWPHLSRIQYQVYEDEKEDDLPPYIKKYRRRNKQLLDLLEGTMPPPSLLQPTESSVAFVKRRKSQYHSHNHKNPKWIMEDLFEEQKANPNNPNVDDDQYINDAQSISVQDSLSSSSTTAHSLDVIEDVELKLIQQNELPGEDVTISSEESNNLEKDTLSTIEQNENEKSSQRRTFSVSSTMTREQQKQRPENSDFKTNKFIYHRVDASPRIVGAGSANGSKKQRLPFVAITDRRLETSKMKQRNFEENHLPML